MNLPGFTADLSVYKASGRYRSRQTSSAGDKNAEIVAQLRGGGGIGVGGGLSWPSLCEWECNGLYALCLAFCPATGPAALGCAALCTKGVKDCLDDCDKSPVVAW